MHVDAVSIGQAQHAVVIEHCRCNSKHHHIQTTQPNDSINTTRRKACSEHGQEGTACGLCQARQLQQQDAIHAQGAVRQAQNTLELQQQGMIHQHLVIAKSRGCNLHVI
jgi:hypothetical protein